MFRCRVWIKGKDRQSIAAQFFKRIQEILDAEGVEYDNKVLVELINKHFPDWRRVLNEVQRYSVSGKIDAGILASFSDVAVNELVKNLKDKNFAEVRKWIVGNLDNDTTVLFVAFMTLATNPWFLLLFLLLSLFSLSISIRERS